MSGSESRSQDDLVQRAFSDGAAYANLYTKSIPVTMFLQERLTKVLASVASMSGGNLLDIGCGPGIFLAHMTAGRFHLFGVDLSAGMIREARARTEGCNVNLTVGRLEHLPFPTGFFDIVVALGVLEYLPVLEAGLLEIARVARPNALIIVSMLNRRSLYRWWETHVYKLISSFRREPHPDLRLWRENALIRIMRGCRLDPIEVSYYDVNVCVPPFDARYPQLSAQVNRLAKACLSTWFPRFLHTGLIIRAHRKPIARSVRANDEPSRRAGEYIRAC